MKSTCPYHDFVDRWIVFIAVGIIPCFFLTACLLWKIPIVRRSMCRFVEYLCGLSGRHDGKIQDLENQLAVKTRENDQLRIKLDEYTQRLSAEMGKKIAANETSVENVGILNRPMNIADEYNLMCSNEWLDAKTACDEECPDVKETQRVSLLYQIIKLAEQEANSVFSSFFQVLMNPFRVTETDKEHQFHDEQKQLPLEVTNAVGDHLRNTADNIDFRRMEQLFKKKLDERFGPDNTIWTKVKNQREVIHYTNKALSIAWKMVIQRPPMTYYSSDKWLGDTYQELYWAGIDPKGMNPSSYLIQAVHPMLYHNNQLMQKGKVFVIQKGSA